MESILSIVNRTPILYNVNMRKYEIDLKTEVKRLRGLGKTYSEIIQFVGVKIPKSTLFQWCKNVKLPTGYSERVVKLNQINLKKAQRLAWEANKIKRRKYLDEIKHDNKAIAKEIRKSSTAMIALAMLCLGEASKYKTKHKAFSLGSSDPRIIIIFLTLLKRFGEYRQEKVRCTVQCRADQNVVDLENYWGRVTNIPKSLFYKARIDPRTKGKPTKNKDYKGVLVFDYYDTKIQLRLESLADLVYNLLENEGL